MPSFAQSNGEDHSLPLSERGRRQRPQEIPQEQQSAEAARMLTWPPGSLLRGHAQRQSESIEPQDYLRGGRQSRPQRVRIGDRPTSQYPIGRLTGPLQFLVNLLEVWRLDTRDACVLLGYEEQDENVVESLLMGISTLRGRDAKDRLASLLRIRTLLANILRDIEAESTWLREVKPSLNGSRPLDLILHGSMEKLLTVRQYVERMAGL